MLESVNHVWSSMLFVPKLNLCFITQSRAPHQSRVFHTCIITFKIQRRRCLICSEWRKLANLWRDGLPWHRSPRPNESLRLLLTRASVPPEHYSLPSHSVQREHRQTPRRENTVTFWFMRGKIIFIWH